MIKRIFPVFLLLSVAGCGFVTSDEWERAEKLCETNGGVRLAWVMGDVDCQNGAKFESNANP